MSTFRVITKSVFTAIGVVLVLGLLFPAAIYAQEATISGTITSATTGDVLPGANILIRGTTVGTATNIDGRYTISVPTAMIDQEINLVATFVGYRASTQSVVATPGTHTVNFEMIDDVLGLEEIVVTGVVGATHKERLPFTVDIVSRSALEQVPYVSADQALRGKVAGVTITKGSGQPGAVSSIRLRGATSITGTAEPLYIVDGVVLGASLVDFDGLDIESIEVVKGAAAASMYGARAANGVIHIRTRRGAELGRDQTTVTFRSEFGVNQLPRRIGQSWSHFYKVDDPLNPTTYIDADGNPIWKYEPLGETDVWGNPMVEHLRVLDSWPGRSGVYFADKPYVGPTFDNIDLFFNPGVSSMNTITIANRTENTNWHMSFHNTREPGVIRWDTAWEPWDQTTGESGYFDPVTQELITTSQPRKGGVDGLTRQNIRLNVDHRVTPDVIFSLSTAYTYSERDDMGRGFFQLGFMMPDVDLLYPNADGEPYRTPPIPHEFEADNPLYWNTFADHKTIRKRFLGNLDLKYSPLPWLNFEGHFSYDRFDQSFENFYDKDFKTSREEAISRGEWHVGTSFNQALNTGLDVNVNREFGLLAMNTRLRYLAEFWDTQSNTSQGREANFAGIQTWDNYIPERSRLFSGISKIRSEGFFLITGLDYDGRYIVDFLVRRDGSSLFGPDDRWHTYYRVSSAYRMAQEIWWPFDPINEFKLRASIGTAGNRPLFAAQYETFHMSAGVATKRTLGNRELKPEFATEWEAGLEVGLWDRVMLELVYANTVVEDQLMFVPLPAYFGFTHQWRNAGTLESKSYEASLRAFLMQTRDISWSMNFNFSSTDMTITEMHVPAYKWGPNLQNADVFYNREGETFGVFYGDKWMTSLNQLPAWVPRDQFDINDDGYVVWVGPGNTWKDGILKKLWGEEVTFTHTFIDEFGVEQTVTRSFQWGMPNKYIDEDGNSFHRIGKALPDFSFAFGSNFRYKGFSAYVLFDAEIGHDVYNQTRQWPQRDDPVMVEQDQFGKPHWTKKPQPYYALLQNVSAVNSHFVESGSYLKLRELSLRYSFDRAQLRPVFGGWVNRLTLGVIGRNLITWTDYTGYDPEVGVHAGHPGPGIGWETGGPQQAQATIVRFDGFSYPNYRSFSAVIEVVF